MDNDDDDNKKKIKMKTKIEIVITERDSRCDDEDRSDIILLYVRNGQHVLLS